MNSFTGSSMSSEEDSIADMGEEVIRHEFIVTKKIYIHNEIRRHIMAVFELKTVAIWATLDNIWSVPNIQGL